MAIQKNSECSEMPGPPPDPAGTLIGAEPTPDPGRNPPMTITHTETPLTTHEVCEHAGITFRQLDYWIRAGVITPAVTATGSGYPRLFTRNQADALRVAAALRSLGAPLTVIAHIVGTWDVTPEGERIGILIVAPDGTISPDNPTGWILDLDAITSP